MRNPKKIFCLTGELEENISTMFSICRLAGDRIMEIYHDASPLNAEIKDDKSPLTKADKEAHLIIMRGISLLPDHFPVISEEGDNVPFKRRKAWHTFWLVDPLDGTKEFLKHNAEFTVNIALIKDQIPVQGFIYAPATGDFFYGIKGKGAFKISSEGIKSKLTVKPGTTDLTAVVSCSHTSAEDLTYLAAYDVVQTIKVGSSLKFCKVAEGLADIYLRTGPTMEWDTAAGQCIAECAGATVTQLDGADFIYNKESLINSGFICKGKR